MKRLTAIFALMLVVSAAFRPAVAQTQTNNVTYVVQAGDDLYRIGLKFGLTVDVVARANGIVNPNVIYVGQRLIIPGIAPTPMPAVTQEAPPVEVATEPATEVATESAGEYTPTPTTVPAMPTTYTVQVHDNLYRISLKFNTTVFILSQLNGLTNPNLIYIGQVLRLPVSGSPRPIAPAATPEATESAAEAASPVPTSEPPATEAPPAPVATASVGGTGGAVIPAAVSTSGNIGFAVGVAVSEAETPANVVKALTDLGAAWVSQTANWKSIEKAQGALDFATLDPAIEAYNAAGLKVLVTVTNAPDWARQTANEDGPPTDFGAFTTFVTNLATRYKGKVAAYEIWNEPNLRRNWNGRPLSAASYVEMLRLAYTAIKSVDSGALIVSAGLAPTGFNDGTNAIDDRVFLKQAYSAGLAAYSDAVGAHPNGWANPPDSTCCQASPGVTGWFNNRSFYFRDTLNDYRQIMKDNNDNGTFIWVTAFGWGASEGVADESAVNDAKFGFVKFTSQAKQAQYLARGFEIGRDLAFVGPMFAFNLNACQSVAGATSSDDFYPCFYSLLDASGKPRPAYDAVKALRR